MVKKEQEELSDFIKAVHEDLRRLSRDVGPEEAWRVHCAGEARLQEYAWRMEKLAKEFWDEANGKDPSRCRVQWVVAECRRYFLLGGWKVGLAWDTKGVTPLPEPTWELPLALLDVGSCYNPFLQFPEFKVTAIDLAPAHQTVLRRDFLSLDPDDPFFQTSSYDIVVFSLLLEYIPTPALRYKCCVQAHSLLKPQGLLFILTPDSKHATANSKLMKNWKIALASIGFRRERYEKTRHLHCMMFRKSSCPGFLESWATRASGQEPPISLLAIPQDTNQWRPEQASPQTSSGVEKAKDTNEEVARNFSFLPFWDT